MNSFGRSPSERAQQTGVAQSTIYRKAARFDGLGIGQSDDAEPQDDRRQLPPSPRQNGWKRPITHRNHRCGAWDWLSVVRLTPSAPQHPRLADPGWQLPLPMADEDRIASSEHV